MQVDIFIRSYARDFEWLGHALKSIHQYVTGYRRIIVAVPVGHGAQLAHLTAEQVIEVPDLEYGYIGQQLTKMTAWKYTDADAILYWDSDCVATEPIDVRSEFFIDGLPILICTPYEKVGDAICWKESTEKAVGFEVKLEYMRRLPMVHWADVVRGATEYVEEQTQKSIDAYLAKQARFSEFNAIGAFAHMFHADRYHIMHTDHEAPPPAKVRQFWSWGGITDEVKTELGHADIA